MVNLQAENGPVASDDTESVLASQTSSDLEASSADDCCSKAAADHTCHMDAISLSELQPEEADVSLEDILCPAGQAILATLFAVSSPSFHLMLLLALGTLITYRAYK